MDKFSTMVGSGPVRYSFIFLFTMNVEDSLIIMLLYDQMFSLVLVN